MRWPHTVRIERAGEAPGEQDKTTGRWTPGVDAPVVIYDGPGDVQYKHRTVRREGDRDQAVQSDADVFLEDETDLRMITEGARVVVTDTERDEVELDGVVVSVGHLDGTLFVSNVVVRPMEISAQDDQSVLAGGDPPEPISP